MSEEVLGILILQKTIIGFARSRRLVYEMWHFTPDRVVVAQSEDQYYIAKSGDEIIAHKESNKTKELKLPLERLLRADIKKLKCCFAIPYSEIVRVELKKGWLGSTKFKMICKESKEYEGDILWSVLERKKNKIEDFENLLRPIFGDKLSVKK